MDISKSINASNPQQKRIAKDEGYFSPSTHKSIDNPTHESTNLVSEDYVKHIEEMNADLLDKIQSLEIKTSLVSTCYVEHLENMNADLLKRILVLEKGEIQKCCGDCEKEKNRIYMARQSESAAESVEEQYFEYLRGK
jgi:hypothetical protein